MGYVRSTLKLAWPEDSEFSGLEVHMRRLSIRKLMEVQSLQDLRQSTDMAESMAAMSSILDTVSGALIGWNLEEEIEQEDGSTVIVKVPATREALDDQDVAMILDLVSNWIAVASSVPLGSRTNSDPTQQPSHPEEPPLEEWASLALPSQDLLSEPVSS